MKKQFTNKARYLGLKLTEIVFALLLISGQSWGQVTIVSDGLNNSTTLFTLSGTGAYYTGNSASGDRPATSPFASEGTHGYGINATSTSVATATLTTTNNISTLGYTGIQLSFKLAAFSIGSTGNGLDATDAVTVELSTNGVPTYTTYLTINGFSNAFWAYTGSSTATTAYPTVTTVAPTAGGASTTPQYGTVTITSLPATSTLKVRITMTNNATAERWVIDDFKITGTSSAAPTKLAITSISPSSPAVGSTFNVTVQAQDDINNPANVTSATDISLSKVTGTGTFGGTLTGQIANGSNSVTISGVTYNTAETGVSLTATPTIGMTGLTPGTSSTFNVLAAASQLAFVSLPSSGTANTNLTSFTIEARRPDNTVDNTYTANVVISKATGSGSISGTTTKACVAGVATFNDIQFNAGDVYTISAASGSLTGATSGSITVLASQPTNSPTVAVFSNVTVNSMDLGWTAASGGADGYIVIMRSGASYSTTDPVDGTTYTAGTVIGDGTVVYSGSATSASVTSLSAGTTYSFEISSYNGSGSSINYKATLPLQGQRSTLFSEPTTQPTALTFTNVTAAGMTIGCTGGNGTNRIFVVKSGSAVDFVPVDGIVYTPNLSFTSGTGLGTNSDNKVVAVTGTSAVVTGLSSNTTYYVAVYELNGSGTTINYLTTSPLTGNRSTLSSVPSVPTTLSFGSVTYNSFTSSFVAPGTPPTGYLVLRRTGSAVTGTPVAGSEYTLGNTIGTGEVVYVGTSVWTAFAQTGLIDNTAYHYAIYSYNGSGTLTNYSATALTGNQSTSSVSSPTANASTSLTSTGFTAIWDASAGASSYKLDVATNNNFYTNETIASEGFENSLTLFTETTGTGTYYSGTSGGSDGPATSPYYTLGTYGYGKNSGSVTITSNSINTASHSSIQMVVKLASFSIGGANNGADNSDIVTVQVSPDGTNYYSTVRVLGNGNAYWAYSATGNATTAYDGDATPVDFQPSGGGSRTTDGYSTITITGLPSTSNLKVRITLLNNSTAEQWVIDDFKIMGNLNNMISGYNDLTVNSNSQAVTGLTPNTTYYYRVRAVGGNSTSANSNVIGTTISDGAHVWTDLTGVGTTSNVTVLSGSTLTISSAAQCNNLTVQNGGQLTINDGFTLTPTGTLTIEDGGSLIDYAALVLNAKANKTISGTASDPYWQWHFLSAPIANQAITGSGNFIDFSNNSANVDFYRYDPSAVTNPWINIKDGSGVLNTADWGANPEFTLGMGYLVAYNSASTAKTFDGNLNTGNTNITLVANKFNLIGNPFPSAINWTGADYAGLGFNSVWIYNENKDGGAGYETFSSGTIAPMQGFFIKSAAATSITLANSIRTHNSSTFYKNSTSSFNELVLKFSNGNNWDVSKIQFMNNASANEDRNDASKLFSMNTAIPQVYTTISTGEKFTVNALPELNANTTVPVGIYVPANGNYSITADGLANLSMCTSVILEDLKTNTTQNLMQNPVYNFTATTTDNANRFVLHFATSVGVNEIGKTNGGIYAYDNNIYVNTNEQIKQISVYNAMGQLIKTLNNVNGLQKINMNGNASGYYIVKVICDKNVYSEKVLIK